MSIATPRRLHQLACAVVTAVSLACAAPAAADAGQITLPLHTHGSRIVDAAGSTVVLEGVNWFGFETSNQVAQGLWTRDYKSVLAQIRDLGFNTIRLPFSLQALHASTINGVDFSGGKNAALRGATPLHAMDVIIKQAARDHLMVLLDCHSDADNGYTEPLWFGEGYSRAEWIDTWRMLAHRYRNQPNVIGADLKNEPHGDATWGGGGPDDWHAAAQDAGDAILSVNPHWLIVVEGIGGSTPGQKVDAHWWGGNLEGVRYAPVRLSRPDQLVYSAHEYGPSVFQQPWFSSPQMAAILRRRWDDEFGFITREGIAPVLIGEFGGPTVSLDTVEGRWQRQFLDYLSRNYLSWTYWSLNPDSGDTGGILENDWTTADPAKVALLHQAMAHRPIAYTGGAATSTPAPPAPTQHQPATHKPASHKPAAHQPASNPPPKPAPVIPGRLAASVTVQSRWQDGWCGVISVAGPAAALGGRSVEFELPAGDAITQQWNGDFSATAGRISVTLPSWATTDGGPYDSSGFCASGTGIASAVTIR